MLGLKKTIKIKSGKVETTIKKCYNGLKKGLNGFVVENEMERSRNESLILQINIELTGGCGSKWPLGLESSAAAQCIRLDVNGLIIIANC